MAKRIIEVLIDDLDGTDAEETVAFALDGVSYVIDLSADNAAILRSRLEEYIGAGRRTGGRLKRGSRTRVAARTADPQEIRAWALEQGLGVAPRGRIATQVVERFYAATR